MSGDARLDMIRSYVERSWAIVPVPARSKNPAFDDWDQFQADPARLADQFPDGRNVGIILGDRSNGLVDVDLDSAEARHLAPAFLPPTDMVHGRASKRSSHRWYRCDEAPERTRRYRDIDGSTLVELRSTGGQTIVPPSVHQSDESLTWELDSEPALVDAGELGAGVARLAAAALMTRHWPTTGSRHDLALALAGGLLRAGWDVESTASLLGTIARAAGDTEAEDRERAARDTADNLAADRACTGLPRAAEIVGERVVTQFGRWLELRRELSTSTASIVGIPGLRPAIEERRPWREILNGVPVPLGSLPERLAMLVGYIRQYTPMFPDDWPIMMALPFWSALWPSVRIQNLNLAVWSLGINVRSSGKNTATEELRAITQAVSVASGQALGLYTAGSPEGMWEVLAGIGKQLLCYHEEFGGFLKLLQRDHMSSAREALCSLYDGRAVGYHRAQKKGIEIHSPHVIVAATINQQDLTAYATRQDLTSGYLSRFMVCAPDAVDTLPDEHPFEHDSVRVQLIDTLTRALSDQRHVTRVEFAETGNRDPDLLMQYRKHLGIGTGRIINLDRLEDEPAVPAGRLFARAKKVAALLALAERHPLYGAQRETVLIETRHIAVAIDIIERSRAYGERMADWIGQSPDVELGNRILQRLTHRHDGMSQRELCNSLRERAREVQQALELLEAEARVHAVRQGRVVRWFNGADPPRVGMAGQPQTAVKKLAAIA